MAYTVAQIEARSRLADAWAGCLVEVDAAVFWIKLAITRGMPIPDYSVKHYAYNVRLVSEYEEQMRAQDIEFVRELI